MATANSSRDFALDVVRRLRSAGYESLWAGGCVRDLLLDRQPGDFDVATSARPEQVRDLFGRRRTLAVGASFGVIIVLGPRRQDQVEVATFRTESSYSDGRRPDSVEFATAEEDAKRRDFTINGMFFDPVAEKIIDYVGGEHDIKARVIRAIGDPHERMTEDKLRLLRAIRFAATLEFELDPATASAVCEMAAQIHVVSAERIAQELRRMLADRHRSRAMQLARRLDLLWTLLPELRRESDDDQKDHEFTEWDRTHRMLDSAGDVRFELAAAMLLHAIPDATVAGRDSPVRRICKRLRLSNQETDDIGWLVESQHALDGARAFSQARLKRLLSSRLIDELIVLSRARVEAREDDPADVDFCERYLAETPGDVINPPLLISGDDLIELGLKPGRGFKSILDAARDAQLNGDIRDRGEAIEFVRAMSSRDGS